MTNCDRMVRDSAMVTMGSVQETTVAVSDGTIDDRLRPHLPQNGDHKRTPRGMSNLEWSYLRNGSSDLLHVSF